MDHSVFLARLIGPAFVAMGIALATQPKLFAAVVEDFIESPGFVYLAGLLGLLAGLALVLAHNVWSADWRVLLTLIGWIALLRGLTTLFLPQPVAAVGRWFVAHRGGFVAGAALSFVLGAVLCYFGYSA